MHELLREFIITELSVDRALIARLRRARGAKTFADRGRFAAEKWLRGLDASYAERAEVMRYAGARFAKIMHKFNDIEPLAIERLNQILNVRFAQLVLRTDDKKSQEDVK